MHDVILVGVGKIARDQHLPAIAANPDFRLVAAVSRHGTVEGVKNFTDFDDFLQNGPEGALALCTPPAVRTEMVLKAVAAGRDLLIEKPPAATMGEAEAMVQAAREAGVVLFATWHSRHAAAAATARDWLADRVLESVEITWKEDVRRWHPNQEWIWQPGGFGVFDPGINALSLLTTVVPGPMHVTRAVLETPENRQTPIGVEMEIATLTGAPVRAVFDWRQEGPQSWNIRINASGQVLDLSDGGAHMAVDGVAHPVAPLGEYPDIYRRFSELLSARESDADLSPLRLVADAFMLGERVTTAAFYD
jgi:D-galactose 1-dehydrogenase